MSKFRLVNLIDKLFISSCIFLLIYAWINFYIRNLWTTFILSLIFSFAIIFVLYYFIDKKQDKRINSKKRTDEINKCYLAFRLLPTKNQLELLKTIIDNNHVSTIHNDTLTYIKDNKKHLIILATNIDKLTETDVMNILQGIDKTEPKNINIVCNSYAPMKTKILKNCNISLTDKERLYDEFFLSLSTFPDTSNIDSSITKFSWRDFLLNLFKPNKARSYFFAGLILLFSSIILPYHIYYRVIGSILILFALTCKLLPTFKNIGKKS